MQKTRSQELQIYIFARDNMEDSSLPKALVSFSLRKLTVFSYPFSVLSDKGLLLKKQKKINV